MTEPRPSPEDGAEPGDGDPTGIEVHCRTQARATEYFYAGLISLCLLAGLVLVLVSVGRSVGPAVFGAFFLGVSAFNGRILLISTASKLSFDSRTGIVRWRSTLRRGALDVGSIRAVRRDRRPGVYALDCEHGSHVEFWLTRRGPDAEEFFRVIGWANPAMATDELYERSGFWWKGFAPRR